MIYAECADLNLDRKTLLRNRLCIVGSSQEAGAVHVRDANLARQSYGGEMRAAAGLGGEAAAVSIPVLPEGQSAEPASSRWGAVPVSAERGGSGRVSSVQRKVPSRSVR